MHIKYTVTSVIYLIMSDLFIISNCYETSIPKSIPGNANDLVCCCDILESGENGVDQISCININACISLVNTD